LLFRVSHQLRSTAILRQDSLRRLRSRSTGCDSIDQVTVPLCHNPAVANAGVEKAKRVASLLSPIAGLLPFLVVFIVKTFVRWRPFWGEYADPELYFFFDALRVHNGVAPANIDHPGTPVQLLGAIVISATGATPLTVDRYRIASYILIALITLATAFLLDRILARDLTPMQRIVTLWLFWVSPAALRYVDIAG